MASISRENIGTMTDKVTIKIAKEDYMPEFEKSLKKYAKSANIPGFRKGMVPTGVVRKMYGVGVYTEVVLRTVEKELNQYMQSGQIEFLGQPLPLKTDANQLDMNFPREYEFAFELGIKPEINVDLKSLTVTRHKVNVTDAMIDEEAEQLKNRYGKMTDLDEVTNEDNVLNVTFAESDAEGNEIEGGINKGNSLLVKYFTEDFRDQLIGKKRDEFIVLQVSKAFGDKEKEWLLEDLGIAKEDADGADKFFKMVITKIGFVEKPAMDETFFAKAVPGIQVTNEEEFRNAVKENIQAQWDAQSRNQLQDQVYHQLIEKTQVELPEQFLKRWMQEGQKEPKTAEEADKEYPSYASSLKWSLLSHALLDQLNVQVDKEEIRHHAKQQVLGYMQGQVNEDAPWLDSYVDKMMEGKKFVEDTYRTAQTDKLFKLLEEQVNVIENSVTPEELVAMQHHHNH